MNKKSKQYVSVKIPAALNFYPENSDGILLIPDYTKEYLEQRARKLFNILMEDVPFTVYSELFRLMKEKQLLDRSQPSGKI